MTDFEHSATDGRIVNPPVSPKPKREELGFFEWLVGWLRRAAALGLLSLATLYLYAGAMMMMPPCLGRSRVIAHVTACVLADEVWDPASFLYVWAVLVGVFALIGFWMWPRRRVAR
jgi:hypothetical protein